MTMPGRRNRVRITIDGLSHEGRGLARVDGKVVFVPGVLPGETVDAELRAQHRRHDEYDLIGVVEAAPDRVEPACALAGTCGGCDLQHLAAEAQLRHKSRVVLELLERQAGIVPEQLDEPLRSAPLAYRRRAGLAVSMPHRGGKPRLGFRAGGSHDIVAVDRCPVLVPALQPLPGLLQETFARLQRPANVERVELALSESSDDTSNPVIHLRARTAPDQGDLALLSRFAAAHDAYLSVETPDARLEVHRPGDAEPGYLLPEFALRLEFQGGDFLQGNAEVNRRLVGRVADWLNDRAGARLLDAFAGIGNFSLPLARRGFEVLGIDVVPEMVARAGRNAERHGLRDITFEARDLLVSVIRPRQPFDVAVLDPPRAGAKALVRTLAAGGIGTLLYVSCSAPTFARDAAVLAEAGYRLMRLALVDMFPQTGHSESIALFERARATHARRAL